MALSFDKVKRTYRYSGITLEAAPEMEPQKVKDLYSAIHPELLKCGIEVGPIVKGEQLITFTLPVVTDKGGAPRLAEFIAGLDERISDSAPPTADRILIDQLAQPAAQRASQALCQFARYCQPGLTAPSDMLDLLA